MAYLKRGLALAVGLISPAVWANCADIVSIDYASAISSNNLTQAAEILSSSPECFGGGATTSQVQVNAVMFSQATAISGVLAGRQVADGVPASAVAVQGLRGASAGGQSGLLNVWASANHRDSRTDYASFGAYAAAGSRSKTEIDVLNTVLGLDYTVKPGIVVGVSAALDRGEGSGGSTDPTFSLNQINSDGYVLAPYLGWQFSREFAVDASAGYGKGKVSTSTPQHSNENDVDRRFAAVNLNYTRWVGALQYTGRASLLHGVERYGDIRVNGTAQANTSARNSIDQLRVGAQVAWWRSMWAPYVGLSYTSDLDRRTTQFGAPGNPIGRTAWVWTAGANFYSLPMGLTGGVAFSREEGRANQKVDSLVANINLRF